MLPNLMLVGLFQGHYGEKAFIMPFVLLYAFEKAGSFFISSFGKIANPFKVYLIEAVMTLAGGVLHGTGRRLFPVDGMEYQLYARHSSDRYFCFLRKCFQCEGLSGGSELSERRAQTYPVKILRNGCGLGAGGFAGVPAAKSGAGGWD